VPRKKRVKKEEIDNILKNYIVKDYIEEIPSAEKGMGWYLPFFEVVNRTKSTPVRLVFDAKAKFNGVSLNQQIMDTPNRLNDITIILTRMRKHKYVFAGDISEMFLQIHLNKEDRKFHRFIHDGRHYQFKRILFGNKSSPNLSQKALSHLCLAYSEHKQAIETLQKSCYMDDCIDSRENEDDMVNLAKELPALLKLGGMKICKIFTNSAKARKELAPEIQAKTFEVEDKDITYEDQKVLGIVYSVKTDTFSYNIKFNSLDDWKRALKIVEWTKRTVLKVTASHFDPLGLASPITILSRRVMQNIWSLKTEWDDVIGEVQTKAWEEALSELLSLPKLVIKRQLPTFHSENEMHIFCDASSEVYACVVYIRAPHLKSTSIVAAKARVTPLKIQSVSRAELDACVLGCRMGHHYSRILDTKKEKVFYYTDSTNALSWINSEPKRLSVYVQRRVAEIQNWSENEQWGHVSSENNPADIPTRSISVQNLINDKMWINGPSFLEEESYKFESFKPKEETYQHFQEGEKILKVTEVENPLEEIASRYSVGKIYNGWRKLLKVVRKMLQWRGTNRDPNEILLRAAQIYSYEGNPEHKDLLKLCPYKDEKGLIRAKSRLINGDHLSHDIKYPVILKTNSNLTRLIVEDYHHLYKHGVGESLFLVKLSQKFIIQGVRKYAKTIEKTCVFCQKIKSKPLGQHMGPLPKELTLHRGRPFAVIGIDFAGPFTVKGTGRGSKSTQKYILVITCLHIRAVHFEICENQTAKTIVDALIRFSCLRGDPDIIYSDNQPSFIRAGKDLGAWTPEIKTEKIRQELEDKRKIKLIWKTITPRSPHQGGRWERMVRAMKRALLAVQNTTPLKDHELRTVLLEAGDMLNSRPLTKGDGEEALTPNHFLHGRKIIDIQQKSGVLQYRKLRESTEKLWRWFTEEILLENREASKWTKVKENLKIGDIVLIIDPGMIKGEWNLGCVTETFPGQDGRVRSVALRTRSEKEMKRSVANLIHIPSWEKLETTTLTD